MKQYSVILATSMMLLANPISVDKIVVNPSGGDEYQSFIEDTNVSMEQNKERLTSKSIATLSTQANMNPYAIVKYLPSVYFTPTDITGSNEPSFHDPIRIRAKSQSGPGGVYMINSIPLSSNPGGGKQLLDMENVSSIDLLSGYLPTDKNLGFSSLIGKVDLNLLAPKKEMGVSISQAFGSDSFYRTFLRADGGKIGDFSLFGSFSTLTNDKYKGKGDLQRLNGMLGISYKPNDNFEANLYAIRNSDEHHNYDSLTYDQTKNLSKYFNKDYKTTKPTSANDVDYYDWNKQDFLTTAIFGDILYKATPNDTITLKPYYKQDKGNVIFSSPDANASKSSVIDWQMDHDLYGVVASYMHKFSQALESKIGYWYHKQLPPGPPANRRAYGVDASGNLKFKKYATLAEVDHHTIKSPFVELSGEISNFVYKAGVQYQRFELSSIKNYLTTNTTSLNYDTALATATYDPWGSVDKKSFATFLPSLYLAYNLDSLNSIYIDYSRTYGFDVNLYPTYTGNYDTFKAKGVKLQQLWDDLELELSDNIDIGYKTTLKGVTLHPNMFVSFVKNKQANVYDQTLKVNYPANLGDAIGYGAELSAYGPLSESLEFLLGLSYNRYYFRDDFKINPTTTSDIKGNQMPDSPKVMAKAALTYYVDRWAFTPSLQYISSRFGDVENKQKIDPYALFDLDISYKMSNLLWSKSAFFRATIANITDKKYISTINTPDNVLAASTTSSTYQTGMPRSIFFSINLNY